MKLKKKKKSKVLFERMDFYRWCNKKVLKFFFFPYYYGTAVISQDSLFNKNIFTGNFRWKIALFLLIVLVCVCQSLPQVDIFLLLWIICEKEFSFSIEHIVFFWKKRHIGRTQSFTILIEDICEDIKQCSFPNSMER